MPESEDGGVDQKPAAAKRRRGIYLLPNLFTTAGLFAGFYAIVAAMGGRYAAAALAVYVAMILDGLDGRVARLTNTQTAFGVEYDSLSDMVSFGLAPALVVYEWALSGLGHYGWLWAKLGWLGAFVFAAGAALRLARFNTQVGILDKRYFQGLPSPAAAAVVVGLVWVGDEIGADGLELAFPALVLTLAAGILMVSNIRYYSFKEVDFVRRVPFVTILLVVMAFVLISIDPPKILFGVTLAYLLSGPAHTLYRLRRHRAQRRAAGRGG